MMRTAFTVAATTLLIARPTLTKAMATTTTTSTTTSTTSNKMPTLKGVVFDMDDTLVRANLDISAMYREVFGKDPSDSSDILKEIDAIESPEEQVRAHRIVDALEEESRQQMTLMPGCAELLTWLSAHKIPTALVTRNGQKTTKVFCEILQSLQETEQKRGYGETLDLAFKRIITRDDADGDHPIPPKPDPAAMEIIAKECFGVTIDNLSSPEILMVGDSISNDVGFGRNAGVQTALLAKDASSGDADICMENLTDLPRKLWKKFEIDGPLGNTEEANQRPLHGSPPPKPTTELCKAVASENLLAVRALLDDLSLDEIMKADDDDGNTALIWAAEIGNSELTSLLLTTVVAKSSDDDNDEHQNESLLSFANHRGFLGATALNRAARRGHTHILELLLSPEEDTGTIQGKVFNMNLPNYKLQHPLHFAAFKKNPEALEYLLRCGANPWVLDRKGRTPLQDTSCERCKSLLQDAMS